MGAQHVPHAFSLVAVIVAVIRDDDIKGDFHNDDVALITTSTRWTNGWVIKISSGKVTFGSDVFVTVP